MRLSMDLKIKHKKALLIINDNLRNRRRLCSLLGDTYNVVVANSVKEGRYIMEASKSSICAVLLNPHQSQEDAISFLHYTQERASLSAIPVLLLLEDDELVDLRALLKEGAVDCMAPPYDRLIAENRIANAMLLRDSMSFYRIEKMLKELPSNIWLKDKEGRFIFSTHYLHNPAYRDDPTWTIRGKTDLEVRADKENALEAMKADREIVATGRGTSYTIETTYDGICGFFEVIKQPVFADDGSVSGIVGLVNNVTEQELLKRNLEKRARTDEMTGLFNRAYFYEYLRDLPNKDFYPVSIISADCDDLKKINDTYGHLAGDDYLKMSVRLFQEILPLKSVLFRIGGDEFVFILPSTSQEKAAALITEMKHAAEAYQLKGRPVSVSYGIATMTSPDDSVTEFIAKSDEKMYQEKRLKKM